MPTLGVHGDGWITLVLFATALVIAVTGNRSDTISSMGRFMIVLVALLAGIAGLHDFSKIYYLELARVGAGLYLVIIAAVVITITATSSGGSFVLTLFALVSTMLVVLAGTLHIPHGDHLPEARLCQKQGWSLEDTFPDVDDLIGVRITELNKKVINALIDCGVLTRTEPPARVPRRAPAAISTYGSCSYYGEVGTCMDVEQCTGIPRPGLCMGPDNIQCCIR